MAAIRGWSTWISNSFPVLLVPVRCGPLVETAIPGFTFEAITDEIRLIYRDIQQCRSSGARYGAASRGAATLAPLLGCRSFVIEEDERHAWKFGFFRLRGYDKTEARRKIEKALQQGGWTWNQ